MTPEAWLTVGVTVAVFVALMREVAPPDVLFLGAAVLLAAFGVITPAETFSGFSNSGVLTVGLLFVVAAGLRETGILDYAGHRLLGSAQTEGVVLRRLAALVLPMSAFLNNTPVVAMLMPVIVDWCRRRQISPSRLLIPLSYLAILGGTCTLIGTSTNLVVNGLMIREYDESARSTASGPAAERFREGLRGMHLFEISLLGVPYAIVGTIYLFAVRRRMLPDRKDLIEQLGESRREYLVEMLVQPGCRLIGQTVEAAGLRHLPGLFLIEIDRKSTTVAPVGPDDMLLANDRLVFTGIVSSIVELEKIPGLVPAADPAYDVTPDKQRNRRLCEAVISESSPLLGKTIRDADFRALYGAAVIAVHRHGARVTSKIGDVEIRSGDTLLLQTKPHFVRAYRNDPAFYLVSAVDEWRALRRDRAWVALGLFALLLLLMTTGITSIDVAAALVAVLMIGLGCISSGEARRSIEWQVLVTIAAAFALGAALQSSGAATEIARGLVQMTQPLGPIAAIACIYLLGSILTEVVTNNAAAVVLFPFCLETARLYNVSPRPFLMALILAASASFVSPIGYQTNMMVYGPGGYRFSDFVKIGLPLNLLLWAIAVSLIPVFWPL